ncbi:MAG: hypothetical protein Q8J78_07370 [Moraxellaceae bacterium]|nr:hypothetical protein [Moraxellaceae bacterium]
MSGTGIIINRDDASPLLARVKDAATAAGLSLVMARAIGIQVKDHLIALNAQRHKFGRNYYARAARSVSSRSAGGFALVSINHVGIRQRLNGGTIRPKAGKRFLTIPATPEAYGMRAREFSDLKVGRAINPRGRIQWALIRKASTAISFTRRKQKDGSVKIKVRPGELRAGGEVIFWLVSRVTQRKDPSVLPTTQQMAAVGVAAAENRVTRLAARASQGGSAS